MPPPVGRIFLVGHNKSGSRSLHHFFVANRLASVHFDHGRLAVAMDRNYMAGRRLLEGYEHYDAFGDMESIRHGEHCSYRSSIASVPGRIIHAYLWFELLDVQYPHSLFVYNTRPVTDWLDSRLHHAGGVYAESYRQLLAVTAGKEDFSLADLRDHWAEQFRRHERNLRAYFGNARRYLELDVSSDDAGERLAAFLERHGYVICNRALPHVGSRNATSS